MIASSSPDLNSLELIIFSFFGVTAAVEFCRSIWSHVFWSLSCSPPSNCPASSFASHILDFCFAAAATACCIACNCTHISDWCTTSPLLDDPRMRKHVAPRGKCDHAGSLCSELDTVHICPPTFVRIQRSNVSPVKLDLVHQSRAQNSKFWFRWGV